LKSFSQQIREEIVADKNLNELQDPKRSFVRDAFLYGGVVSNPGRTYHLEFTLPEDKENNLMEILSGFNLSPKRIARKGKLVVYIKEADEIADVLNIIGAHKSMLELENVRIEKSVRNAVNRKVNFETANLNKTVDAAINQIDAIKYITQSFGLSYLSDGLEEIARLRLQHETASLAEIGAMASPPIGKSGVNHRLRKICKIAETLKKEK